MVAQDLRGVASLDHKGRIYLENKTKLHTKNTGYRPCGFREYFFHVIHIKSFWQIMQGVANFDPRGRIIKDIVTKYNSPGPHGSFQRRFITGL